MQKFDNTNQEEIDFIIESLKKEMTLDDYAVMKLEIVIKNELPFYAATRELVLDWLRKNFIA